MLRFLWTAKKKKVKEKRKLFILFFSEIQYNVLFSCHCHVTLIYTSGIWHCTMFE